MLLYFICGFLAYALILPLLEEGRNFILDWIGHQRAKISLKIAKINKEAQDFLSPEAPDPMPIGFQVCTEEEFYDEDDE